MDLPQFSPAKAHFPLKEHLTKNGDKTQNTKHPAIKPKTDVLFLPRNVHFEDGSSLPLDLQLCYLDLQPV